MFTRYSRPGPFNWGFICILYGIFSTQKNYLQQQDTNVNEINK